MAGWDEDPFYDADRATIVERLRADPEPKASETYKKLADKRLTEQMGPRYCRIEPLQIGVPLVIREPTDHLSPESWGIYPTGVYEQTLWNAELQGDMHQQTPQALLRDLHRTVRRNEPYFLEPVEGQAERHPCQSVLRSVDVMKREALVEARLSLVLLDEADILRRQYYREPWQAPKRDDEPRTVFSNQPVWDDG